MIELLMTSMLMWMGANCTAIDGIHPKHNPCQYNYNVKLPKVTFLSQKDLKYEFYSRGSKSNGRGVKADLYGFYRETEEKIFLENTWRIFNINDKATLFHELFHHVQFKNVRRDEMLCISHVEVPTILFEKKYINSLGRSHKIYLHLFDNPCNVYYKGI